MVSPTANIVVSPVSTVLPGSVDSKTNTPITGRSPSGSFSDKSPTGTATAHVYHLPSKSTDHAVNIRGTTIIAPPYPANQVVRHRSCWRGRCCRRACNGSTFVIQVIFLVVVIIGVSSKKYDLAYGAAAGGFLTSLGWLFARMACERA